MEFTVKRDDLLRELKLLSGVLETKTTIPALGNVFIHAAKGVIELRATDLEIALRATCPAEVRAEGTCCLPGKKLAQYVAAVSGEVIHVKQQKGDGRQFHLSADKDRVRLSGLDCEQFPAMPEMPPATHEFSPDVFAGLIGRVAFAISTESSRYTLNAALLAVDKSGLLMVATDGHRLSWARADYEGAELRALLPARAAARLAAILGENTDPAAKLHFGADENHLGFANGTRELLARKLAGQFPAFEAVLPKSNGLIATAPLEALRSGLRLAGLFSDERSCAVKFSVAPGQLTMQAHGAESEATVPLEAEYSGTPAEIGFNWHYIHDFLEANRNPNAGRDGVPEQRVELHLKDEQSAAEFRIAGDASGRYVVMPIRM